MLLHYPVFIVFVSLFFGLDINAQISEASLSGTIYDDNGAVILNAEITVIGSDKILRTAITNDEGIYYIKTLVGDNAIQIKANGFQTYFLEKYRISNSYKGRMIFDVVLEAHNPEPCGHGGCLPINRPEFEKEKLKVSDTILPRALDTLPKRQSKSKSKINNKQ